jgi:iron complex outermembrane receptor protein
MIRSQNDVLPAATLEQGRESFKKFTWNLMLGYDVADGINTYARAATGYRSGGYNSQDLALTGTSTLPSFKPEQVTSYEVGVKSELFDRRLRLNIAGYHNIYKDLAVNVPVEGASPGTFATRIDNAGKVTYTGIEVEALAILSENFTFEGNLGYIDIKYKEFAAGRNVVPGQPPVNIASIVTPGYTSPLTANAALNAQFPLSGNLTLRGRVSYTHEDGKYSFATPNTVPFNEQIKGDDRDLIDAQISIEGFRLGGGEAAFKIWGKNLTNSKDFVRGIDFGALGIAGGYYADPRTYGASLSVSF